MHVFVALWRGCVLPRVQCYEEFFPNDPGATFYCPHTFSLSFTFLSKKQTPPAPALGASNSRRCLLNGPTNRQFSVHHFQPFHFQMAVFFISRCIQPVLRSPVAPAPQAAPATANEWGITLEDSSVDDPSAASGGAALPEGLFYAFERPTQQTSSESSGSAAAGGSESVADLMAQLQGL